MRVLRIVTQLDDPSADAPQGWCSTDVDTLAAAVYTRLTVKPLGLVMSARDRVFLAGPGVYRGPVTALGLPGFVLRREIGGNYYLALGDTLNSIEARA